MSDAFFRAIGFAVIVNQFSTIISLECSQIPASLVEDLLTEVFQAFQSFELFLQEVACGMIGVVINDRHMVEGATQGRCRETAQVGMNEVIRSGCSVFDRGWIGVLRVVLGTPLTEEVGRTVGKEFTISESRGRIGPDLWG